LNVAGYYDAFIALLDQMVTQGFLDAKSRNLMIIESNFDDLLAKMSLNN
jgi:predicted Rossmann-fold nucleotide-binding protein